MGWTRLDDGWTEQPVLADLSYEARWHYLCMIQFCSRTQRFDGFIRSVDAKRCSDVPDPDKCLKDLVDVGLILCDQRGYVVHLMAEDHAPPAWVRNRTESNKQAKRRQRSHEAGDHSICLPTHCPEAQEPSRAASIKTADRHADNRADSQDRTGQDRLRTKSFKAPEVSSSTRGNLALDPDAWPTDEEDVEWRSLCHENNVVTVQGLMAVCPHLNENQALNVLMRAFPGREWT